MARHAARKGGAGFSAGPAKGGFGVGTGRAKRGGTSDKRLPVLPKRVPVSNTASDPEVTAMVRKSQIEKTKDAVEDAVRAALARCGDDMERSLREQGWWTSDMPVLPKMIRVSLRAEVEALWAEGYFKLSQSVRGAEYYDKENVYATEITGDTYSTAPLMVHYTVAATREMSRRIRAAFPDAQISEQFIGNKLNLCVGNGAHFDPHLDIGVAEKPFRRKLTLLLYLNSAWRKELGGEITLLGEGGTEKEAALDSRTAAAGLPKSLPPSCGRWLVFWSDKMLHRVEPFQAPAGLHEYRTSYTIWFCTDDPAAGAGDIGDHVPAFVTL